MDLFLNIAVHKIYLHMYNVHKYNQERGWKTLQNMDWIISFCYYVLISRHIFTQNVHFNNIHKLYALYKIFILCQERALFRFTNLYICMHFICTHNNKYIL